MKLQESGQMYLETIYVLSKTVNGVHSIDISEHMGYSKPESGPLEGRILQIRPEENRCSVYLELR